MFWAVLGILGAWSLLSCSEPPDPTTPKGAFSTVAPCIDRADRQCFFRCLERDSRWSIYTIHRTLVEMRGLVEKSYPEALRESAYGIWSREAVAPTPEAMFEIFCKKRKCLESMAKGFGAVTKVTPTGPDTVTVETVRGATYPMARAAGKWGLDLYREELNTEKIRLFDRLEQVRINAKQYEEQRLAQDGDR